MSDDYDLEVLLELRENERDEAEQCYAEALQHQEKLQKRLDELEVTHRRMVAERKREHETFADKITREGTTPAKMRKFDRFMAGLRDREEEILREIERTQKKCRRAQKEVERAQSEMRQAVRDLKAVEQHYEKWQREQEKEQRRRQSEKMDDIAARLWREQSS